MEKINLWNYYVSIYDDNSYEEIHRRKISEINFLDKKNTGLFILLDNNTDKIGNCPFCYFKLFLFSFDCTIGENDNLQTFPLNIRITYKTKGKHTKTYTKVFSRCYNKLYFNIPKEIASKTVKSIKISIEKEDNPEISIAKLKISPIKITF